MGLNKKLDGYTRFKKKDKATWPTDDKQSLTLLLKIKNRATGEKRIKIIDQVFFNKNTKAFCYLDYNLSVSIPDGCDKTKIYYKSNNTKLL